MTDKKTIVTISDHPCASSGVGLQTRYIIDHLVKTGKYRIISIAAAIRHDDYRLQKVENWGDDVIIVPCDGYGNQGLMRQIMDNEYPDALWIMTDPRFYQWLFTMEHEIRSQMPILYNTIWDNYPPPRYNSSYYGSVNFLGCINKLTLDCVKKLGYGDIAKYIPHGVPKDEFKILYDKTSTKLKVQFMGEDAKDCFVLFYNSRNALRKRTGNVMMAFKHFRDNLPEEERKNVILLMHTPPKDPEGQDLYALVQDFDLKNSVRFSPGKVPPQVMCELYNCADVTVSLSSEEGFGLSILESLMCGTPVVCTRTGGMQDQAIDEDGTEYGFCVEPDARSLIGSQVTPYIWSDHVDPKTAAEKFKILYDDWKKDKDEYKNRWAGEKSRESALKRFNLEEVQKTWEEEIERVIEEFKSSERKLEVISI